MWQPFVSCHGRRVIERGRNVKDAVPGREDGNSTVTVNEVLPPKANGGMQILDTWSLTPTCPSGTTSISSSTTSTRSSRECCQVKWKEVKKKTVQSSTSCGGCRQWRPGGPEHSDPRFAWQDDVNATVINALQMSSFCHLLVAGPSCFTEPSVFRIVDPQGRTEFLENHEGQYSRAATEQHKTSNQVEMAMEPKQIAV